MNSQRDRILSMIGMARRAGRIVSGEFAAEKAVKTGRAYLVIVASDASDNTKKMFRNMCASYDVPFAVGAEKHVLGHATGQGMRASLAVTDENLARVIEKLMNENTDGGRENGERAEC